MGKVEAKLKAEVITDTCSDEFLSNRSS